MRLPNHIAGGFCLTGFFASVFFGVNVLASPATAAALIAGSIFPDADNPKSLAGKLVYPIARWINRKTGHRTLTHSLIFMLGLAILSGTLEKTFLGSMTFTVILTTAWFVHVILDTFTLQGVQLMFPFSFEPYFMFGRLEARIRNGDIKAEGAFFLAFVTLSFAQTGLWENGFWTSYNKHFGTIQHLESEMRRSTDAIEVTAFCKLGTNEIQRTGKLIEASGAQLVLLSPAGFTTVGDDEQFLKATFAHTGQTLLVKSATIINATADSINQTLLGKAILSLDIQANQPFQITEPNGFSRSATNFKTTYTTTPGHIAETGGGFAPALFVPDESFRAELQQLDAEIQRLQRTNANAADVQRSHEANIQQLKRDFAATTDISQRQRIHNQIEAAENEKTPEPNTAKIAELQERYHRIERENNLRNAAKRKEIEGKNLTEAAKIQPTRFTGIVSWVEIQ